MCPYVRGNIEKSVSQNVLKTIGRNLQCMIKVANPFSKNKNFVPRGYLPLPLGYTRFRIRPVEGALSICSNGSESFNKLTVRRPSSVRPFTPLNDFSSETPGPIFFKLHVDPSVKGGLKCSLKQLDQFSPDFTLGLLTNQFNLFERFYII